MRYLKLTNNQIFREFKCGLSQEETATLCFKKLSTIEKWDRGEEIPPECRRLMRMYSRREFGMGSQWNGFEFLGDKIKTPAGHQASAQQILTGLALIEISSELDVVASQKLLRFARVIASLKTR